MNIYILKALNEVDYDSYKGHVIRATSEGEARHLAPHGDEGAGFWLNKEKSSCYPLSIDKDEPQVILSAFNVG